MKAESRNQNVWLLICLTAVWVVALLLAGSLNAQPIPKAVKPSLYFKVVASPRLIEEFPALVKTNKLVIWWVNLTNGCKLDFASTNGIAWVSNINCPKTWPATETFVLARDTNGASVKIAFPKVYGTTNLVDWYFVTNLTAVMGRSWNVVKTKPHEFFQIRP